jgi:NADPH-dependent curcumin reductase CurA
MTGVTAWMGLTQIRPPKSGQTFVVSAASGAVGSIAGQIAKIMGAKVIGIAGGPEKCDYVVSELGFDACVDYRSPNFVKDLAGATPAGVDFNFENVGGPVMEAVVARLNPFATVALCGLNRPAGLAAISTILAQRVRMEGFIVADRLDLWPRALTEIADWYSKGLLKQGRETVAQGIEAAPEAFIGLLRGDNFGKQLVGLV